MLYIRDCRIADVEKIIGKVLTVKIYKTVAHANRTTEEFISGSVFDNTMEFHKNTSPFDYQFNKVIFWSESKILIFKNGHGYYVIDRNPPAQG